MKNSTTDGSAFESAGVANDNRTANPGVDAAIKAATESIASDKAFPPAAKAALEWAAALMIPAEPTQGLPAADDAIIFAEILRTLSGYREQMAQLLSLVHRLFDEHDLTPSKRLDEATRNVVTLTLSQSSDVAVATFVGVVIQCYYRDDRVMARLGMPPRAPFPEGYEIAPGDWHLLDAVRVRKSFYRHPSTTK